MLLPSIFGSSTCTIGSNGCGLNSISINAIAVNSIGKTGKPVYMVLAFANGCTHCEALNDYIRNLSNTYDIRMTYINAVTNQTALTRYFSYYKVPTDDWDTVPILFVNNTYCVGDAQCESFLSENMAAFAKNGTQPIEASGPGLGSLTIAEFTGLALVDSVNPCAFAVLIFLLSTLFMRNPNKRHRILLGGISFALGIFAFYITVGVLLVLGIRSVLAVSNLNSVWVYGAFGVFAIILGILNLKDYVAYGKFGFAMEVPKRWRPRMLGTMDKILFEFASIPASFVAGVVVTAFLLPCITGPYFVAGSLLRNLPTGAAILWLAYYNFLFILPMLIITALVYMSFTTVEKAHAFREKNIRKLHLLAGVMLLIVGIVILLQVIR
jgi:thiol-disulfide isomerase/thioredoxin